MKARDYSLSENSAKAHFGEATETLAMPLFTDRTLKGTMHEFGHAFSLPRDSPQLKRDHVYRHNDKVDRRATDAGSGMDIIRRPVQRCFLSRLALPVYVV
jgi:hypothetical protein